MDAGLKEAGFGLGLQQRGSGAPWFGAQGWRRSSAERMGSDTSLNLHPPQHSEVRLGLRCCTQERPGDAEPGLQVVVLAVGKVGADAPALPRR